MTQRKQAILALFLRHQAQGQLPPTTREIMDAAEINSTSLTRYYLRSLARDGLISITPKVSRGAVLAHPVAEPTPSTRKTGIVVVPLHGILRDHRIIWITPEAE